MAMDPKGYDDKVGTEVTSSLDAFCLASNLCPLELQFLGSKIQADVCSHRRMDAIVLVWRALMIQLQEFRPKVPNQAYAYKTRGVTASLARQEGSSQG